MCVPCNDRSLPVPLADAFGGAKLRAVFLDAGGTLLAERLDRAAIYRQAAQEQGLSLSELVVRQAMHRTHARLDRSEDGFFRYTLGWFERFNERLLCSELGLERTRLRPAQRWLEEHFSNPGNYAAQPGARELLASLKARGLRVGVISNWSEFLPRLLEGLSLSRGIDFCLVSALARTEKPEPGLFRRALDLAGVGAHEALHAGNDFIQDVQAAQALGILAMLVGAEPAPPNTVRAKDLHELRQWIEALEWKRSS